MTESNLCALNHVRDRISQLISRNRPIRPDSDDGLYIDHCIAECNDQIDEIEKVLKRP